MTWRMAALSSTRVWARNGPAWGGRAGSCWRGWWRGRLLGAFSVFRRSSRGPFYEVMSFVVMALHPVAD